MKKLSFAEGRINAAGCKKLAAFFLLFLICVNQIFSQKKADSRSSLPFSANSKLYLINQNDEIKEIQLAGNRVFIQRGVCQSKKEGFILAWDQKAHELLHVNSKAKIVSSVGADGASAFLNTDYILLQSNAWTENRGFEFTLYKIKYAKFGSGIKLKKIWSGLLDCFVSDYVFTEDGICIAGGTKDNSIHNVYSLTKKGLHKCFSINKNSDFLRLVQDAENKDQLYAFVSQREKINAGSEIYFFNISGLNNSFSEKKLFSDNPELLKEFECFFGYGFMCDKNLILPCSFEQKIKFVSYDVQDGKIKAVTDNVTGCNFPLGSINGKFYYIAKDPLIPDSFYGISFFDGKEIKSVFSFIN